MSISNSVGRVKASGSPLDLHARGLLELQRLRTNSEKNGPLKSANKNITDAASTSGAPLGASAASNRGPSSSAASEITPLTSQPSTADILVVQDAFKEYLQKFLDVCLLEPCTLTLVEFWRIAGKELFLEDDEMESEGIIRDLLVINRVAFLKCLQHPNWHWRSLTETEQLKTLFMRDILPCCSDAESVILLARIGLKQFALAVREENRTLAQHFICLLSELCRLKDFPAVFMWVLIGLLACDEMLPYLAGGTCQVVEYLPELDRFGSISASSARHLGTPTLLRFRPEPRALKPMSKKGLTAPKPQKRFKTVIVNPALALANQTLALDALALCCDLFCSRDFRAPFQNPTYKSDSAPVISTQDSPDSPHPTDTSPASPEPEATGLILESPASPELPEMRSSKTINEKLPDCFRVELKDSMMKLSLIATEPEKVAKLEDKGSFASLRKSLYALGGWYWLAVCLIDTLRPEESDKTMMWPEFQTVAFFNRNVHIANAFRRNPIWMKVLEAAAFSDAFLYYSPLVRPVFISLYTHWETSLEGPKSLRNKLPREQTLWLLRCLGTSKMLHEPYCYLGTILEFLVAHEISSILSSVWKIVKTYLPNPHGLISVPPSEQDFRAKQMAETDCLLKIRAVVFTRLDEIGILGKKFFTIARVPLEESRWFESTQSQETTTAPAPINANHLTKVD